MGGVDTKGVTRFGFSESVFIFPHPLSLFQIFSARAFRLHLP